MKTVEQIEPTANYPSCSFQNKNGKTNHIYLLVILFFQALISHVESVSQLSIESNKISVQQSLLEERSSHLLSTLLPYEMNTRKEGALRTGLGEYLMLVKALRDAASEFHLGNLEKFDSLVGENACQIRAIYIAKMASRKERLFLNFEEKISTASEKINSLLLDAKKMHTLMSSGIDLGTLIETDGMNIEMNCEEMFLFQSFLLTIAKTVKEEPSLCRKEFGDSNKLKVYGEISSSFAKNLVNKARKLLSENSVRFVRDIALAKNDPVLNKMISDDFTISHNNLLCMPMFWSCKAVFESMHEDKIPLAIHVQFLNQVDNSEEYRIVDEEILFFESIENKEGEWDFIAKEAGAVDLELPVCTVKGVVCLNSSEKGSWRERFLSFPILHVILSGAADHRQYPDPNMNEKVESLADQEYGFFKAMAKEHGFSLENPTNFFINHVYATKAKNLIGNFA